MTSVATRSDGFVVRSEIDLAGEDARRGTVEIRVPSERFEEAMSAIRELGMVERETIQGRDMSEEFVDLESRLRNLGETVLLRLMDEAGTVADTIRVQKELSGIQGQVEEIKGRIRFLSDRTALGTILVILAEPGAGEAGAFGRAWNQAVAGFVAVISGIISFLGVLVPLGLLSLAGWVGYRVMRGRGSATGAVGT